MQSKKPFAMLLFACLMAALSTALMIALTAGGSRAMAQTGPEPANPAGIESGEALEEGPVIDLGPRPAHAVGLKATNVVTVTNQHTVSLYYVRTDYEPSPPSWVASSTCPRLNQVATDTFQSPMAPGERITYTCAVTVNAGVFGTLPFTMRVRSIDPFGQAPYLGDSGSTQIIVAPFDNFLYMPMILKGS
jgi:hypothetical protein